MNLNGKIIGFGKYTTAAFEKVREDLGLTLPLNMLASCANYYRTQEKRDPLIEELRMIDRFAALCRPRELITELLTNDTCVARTYADAIAKRRILRPDASAPIITDELFELATQSLRRVGKASELCGYTARIRMDPASLSPALTLRAGASGHFAELSRSVGSPLASGDLFVLIRNKELKTIGTSLNSVAELLVKEGISSTLKKCVTVPQGGLLALLLSLTAGAQIDLTRLSLTGEPIAPTMLADAYENELVVVIARQDYNTLAGFADRYGLRLHAFASMTSTLRYTFFYTHDKPTFAFESLFLRSLIPTGSHVAALGDENGCDRGATISHRTVRGSYTSYLASNPDGQSEALLINGLLCTSAFSAPTSSYYQNAVETALAPILTLAASGADYPEVRLTLSIERPTEPSEALFGGLISTMLGFYRTQVELAIPAMATQTFYKKDANGISTSVLGASANGTQLPSRFTADGNGIYCLAPARDADSQIDFEALRSMLTYLTSAAREGAIKSVRLLCREAITSALQEMRTDTLVCRVTDPIWMLEDDIPLALLIEADREIAATRIGYVVSSKECSSPAPQYELPDHESLLPTEGNAVTLIAEKSDTDAANLALALRDGGAQVQLHSSGDEVDTIARSLLASDTVILCGKASLPATDTLRFAAATFESAGGSVLLLGGACRGIFD